LRRPRTEDNYEPDREHPASEITLEATKQRYGLVGTENIGYKRANRYGRRQSQFEELLLSHPDAAYNVAVLADTE
jgi:hypothetical protein